MAFVKLSSAVAQPSYVTASTSVANSRLGQVSRCWQSLLLRDFVYDPTAARSLSCSRQLQDAVFTEVMSNQADVVFSTVKGVGERHLSQLFHIHGTDPTCGQALLRNWTCTCIHGQDLEQVLCSISPLLIISESHVCLPDPDKASVEASHGAYICTVSILNRA